MTGSEFSLEELREMVRRKERRNQADFVRLLSSQPCPKTEAQAGEFSRLDAAPLPGVMGLKPVLRLQPTGLVSLERVSSAQPGGDLDNFKNNSLVGPTSWKALHSRSGFQPGSRRWPERLLLAAEVGTLVAFVVVVALTYSALQQLRAFGEEVSQVGGGAYAGSPAALSVDAFEETPVVIMPAGMQPLKDAATVAVVSPGGQDIVSPVQATVTVAQAEGYRGLVEYPVSSSPPEQVTSRPTAESEWAERVIDMPPGLSGEMGHALPVMVGELPRTTPVPDAPPPTRIAIAKLKVDTRINQGDGWKELYYSAGHHIGTANPGQSGNMVIAAHADIYGGLFKDLDTLEIGDLVVIYAGQKVYRYQVTSKRIVAPTAVEVMAPTPDPTLTLISCWPYMVATHRIVVKAKLVS